MPKKYQSDAEWDRSGFARKRLLGAEAWLLRVILPWNRWVWRRRGFRW